MKHRRKMNYDHVLTNTLLTSIAEYTLWLVRVGGAVHIGTNRDKTSLLIKVFTPIDNPVYFWYNDDTVELEYIKELNEYVTGVVSQLGSTVQSTTLPKSE